MKIQTHFSVKWWLLATLFFMVVSISNAQMRAEETSDGIWIYDKDQPVLFYQSETKALEGKYARANYVHPLYDLGGNVITEDFPEDHYHHRGIFWTWHQILIGNKRIGDAWLCENFTWDIMNLHHQIINGNAQISAKVDWKSPNWEKGNKAFASENVTITAYPVKQNYRIIDFKIEISALVNNLYIGGSEDDKGYGGFSTRIKLPDDIDFYSQSKRIKPERTAVKAGSWMNINSGFHDNEPSGFVIIQHPDNPAYPQLWILRNKNSMQNAVYPGREPVNIEMNNPLLLKYRIVLYNGKHSSFDINKVSF